MDEGVRMVMHEGQLINSKTEWFSPSIVRTTIEKGGVEMAYKPARGSYQASSRNHPPSDSQPVGMAEGSKFFSALCRVSKRFKLLLKVVRGLYIEKEAGREGRD